MTKWKRPTKVDIGALKYKIKYVTPGKSSSLLPHEAGCIDQQKALIEIDKSLSDQHTLIIVMHEILHGVGDAMQPNKTPFCNEKFTSIVAELLVQALQSSKLVPTLPADSPRQTLDKQPKKK